MATLGHGTELKSDVISNIGDIRSIGFSASCNSLDATQTLTPYTQSVPSGFNAGVMSVSFLYNGNHGREADEFMQEMRQRRLSRWRVQYPDGSYESYGYISSISISGSVGSVITMDAVITLTGEPFFFGS